MDYLKNLIKSRLEICLKMLSSKKVSKTLKKEYLDEYEYLKELPLDEDKLTQKSCRYCKKGGAVKICSHCGKEWVD
jgi:hypothetical protein